MLTEKEFDIIIKEIKKLLDIDLNYYKPAQMKRRIGFFVQRHKLKNFSEFISLLHKDTEVLKTFKAFITINVTEFFRNIKKFNDLTHKILPELITNMGKNNRNFLNIWSAGTSVGAEAYTIAIIMEEHFSNTPYSIFGTDIDKKMLQKAIDGKYKDNEVKTLSLNIKRKYFSFNKKNKKWEINNNIKKQVEFTYHNLLQDPFNIGYDLILCRNVVIYFTEESKDTLYKKFYESLHHGGVLFIGGTESIMNAKKFGFKHNFDLFYYK